MKYTLTSDSGKVFELIFSHVYDDKESDKAFEDFYIADNLLTWGLLYEVGCAKHQLEQGHDCHELVIGQDIDIICDFIHRLNDRLREHETLEWEVALPSSYQWSVAYKRLMFCVESEKRIYEYTTTVEPLYSTRDNALMQRRRVICYSGASSRFPHVANTYELQDLMINVGIRFILKKRIQNSFKEEIMKSVVRQVWKNRQTIVPFVKSIFNKDHEK